MFIIQFLFLGSDNQVSPGSDEVFTRTNPLSHGNMPTENTRTAFARVAPRVASQPEEQHYAKPRLVMNQYFSQETVQPEEQHYARQSLG